MGSPGPSAQYLADLQAGLSPFDAGASAAGVTPGGPQQLPVAPQYGGSGSSLPSGVGAVPVQLPGIEPAPALPPAGPPTADQMPPPPPPAGAPAGPAGPPAPPPAAGAEPPGLDPTQVEFRPVGGGSVPAHEMHIRGPQQESHLLAAYGPPAEAAQGNELRSALQAQHEADMYERQAEAAQARQDAAERVALRRQAEMQSMMQDYQDSVQRLGEMHLDQNRWWGNQTTGEKIANLATMFAGGFFGGGNGVAQRIYRTIDQDIEAQKFDYNAGLDQARAKQTAFGMMMDRYGSEDAATAAARAAALDYAAAKVQQEAAQWKGTGAQNQTATLLGDLAGARENTIAAGFRFIPATAAAPRYQMAFRGHVAPGTFGEKEAQANFIEHQTKPAQEADKTILGGEVSAGVGAATARAKAEAEAKAKGQENLVVLPSGETFAAPSEAEAKDVRKLIDSRNATKRLVNEALKIRNESALGVPLDIEKRARLDQIQAELLTNFGVDHQLGALSDKDYAIAQKGTADAFAWGPGTNERLTRLGETADAKLRDRVKTYATAPPKASGKMPPGFQRPGGAK